MKLTVSHEFRGMGDYWGGNGRRWDDDAGCVFAYYGKDTTLRDCVDQWVEDFWSGGDFIEGCKAWDEVTRADVRAAILESMTEQGRADYESGALCDGAAEWEFWKPADETLKVGDTVRIDVNGEGVVGEVINYVGLYYTIECDDLTYNRPLEHIEVSDDDAEYCESPVWILLIELEGCDENG